MLKTNAIVLNSIPYSEASLIVKVYSREGGLLSLLINGVRKSKAKFPAALFQPLSLLEIVYYPSRGEGRLCRLKEARPNPPLLHILNDPHKSAIAFFLSEVIQHSIREEEYNAEVYDYIAHGTEILDLTEEKVTNFHLCFMLQLSRYLGFYPSGRYGIGTPVFDLQEGIFMKPDSGLNPYTLSPSVSRILDTLMNYTLQSSHKAPLTATERRSLLESLIHFYSLHQTQGFELRSPAILSEVLG